MHRIIRSAEATLTRSSKGAILACAIALVLSIAVLDYASGTDVSLVTLNWIPVAVVVWYVGIRSGLALSLGCIMAAALGDIAGGRQFHHPAVGFGSEFIGRSIAFIILCILTDLLRERTKSLRMTTAQLRAFDYSVAHDLRSPVRVITSFAEIISLKGTGLDETSRDLLKRIVGASLKLSAMLEGLLLLSNLSERRIIRETVDLGELSRRILNDLEVQLNGPRRELRLPKSMPVFADRQLLTILMNNLLQNAWKFTARAPAPVIELGVERQDGTLAFYVRDNGEGFDPAYAGSLFQPFHRLPNAKGVEGQGIGLATAARAVQAHGGRLWANGALGRGATFFFTLGSPS